MFLRSCGGVFVRGIIVGYFVIDGHLEESELMAATITAAHSPKTQALIYNCYWGRSETHTYAFQLPFQPLQAFCKHPKNYTPASLQRCTRKNPQSHEIASNSFLFIFPSLSYPPPSPTLPPNNHLHKALPLLHLLVLRRLPAILILRGASLRPHLLPPPLTTVDLDSPLMLPQR